MNVIQQRFGKRGFPRAGFVIRGHFVGTIAGRLYWLFGADTETRGISNSQLATRLGTSRRTVQYALRELESAGLVETAYTRLGRYVEPVSIGQATAPSISPFVGTTAPARPRRRVRAAS